MNLPLHELIGYCAAFLTTIAFLPQAIQSWRTRDLSGISVGMYSLFTTGVGLWLIYGLHIEKWPIILANALTFILALSILLLKLLSLNQSGVKSDGKPDSKPEKQA